MKKLLLLSLAVAALLGGCEKSAPDDDGPYSAWDGVSILQPESYVDGSSGTVYIASAAELAWLASACNRELGVDDPSFEDYDFILTTNIDLKNKPWTPIGKRFYYQEETEPYDWAGYFRGGFDGKNHKIANLVVEPGHQYSGIFGKCYGIKEIKNIHVISGSVEGEKHVGSICGEHTGRIVNCSNQASVSGCQYVGGICGYNNKYIIDCSNAGRVTGKFDADERNNVSIGGICGHNAGWVKNCSNTGVATGRASVGGIAGSHGSGHIVHCVNHAAISGGGSIGGICGYSSRDIMACYNTGNITGTYEYEATGGVCGHMGSFNSSYMSACYNVGTVTGRGETGGVCGWLDGTMEACYSIGAVTGTSQSGGVCGTNNYGNISACYWNENAETGIGLIGEEAGSDDVRKFSPTAWPSAGTGTGKHAEWGTGDGSGAGKYWKSLGRWSPGGTGTVYPKLWFE